MEQSNLPVVAKRIWNIVRVMFYMLRKNISKRKLMVDLNMMMKRGKIARKAIHNLMFHHHPNNPFAHHVSHSHPSHEYEFSCSNSPAFFPALFNNKRNKHNHNNFFACAHAPQTDDDVAVNAAYVRKTLEMLNAGDSCSASPVSALSEFWQSPAVKDLVCSELSSPALPGFGRTPAVRQLRITDSPFPLRDMPEDSHVDEAAEEFISRFYSNLRRQNKTGMR